MAEERDEQITGLHPLDELDDYEVADDDPDIRGWDVIGAGGKKLGEVEELIVDPEEMRVRYLKVDVVDDLTDDDDDERKLLIPIGVARLDEDEEDVIVPSISDAELRSYPAYLGGPVDREHEWAVCRIVVPDTSSINDDNFYDQEHFNERRLFGPRTAREGVAEPMPQENRSRFDNNRPVIRRRAT